jgi:hypothetical protein
LEEAGSSLFSLFWKNLLEAHCFHHLGRIWKLTVFTIWEESAGSSLFSPFRKNLEAHCFHYFRRICWKLTVFTILEESGTSLFSLFWKNLLEAHCFYHFVFPDCFVGESVIVKTVSFQIVPKQRKQF